MKKLFLFLIVTVLLVCCSSSVFARLNLPNIDNEDKYIFSNAFLLSTGNYGLGPVKITGGKRDFKWPVPGTYTLSGCFYDNTNHCALDICAPIGTPVVASYTGKVIQTYNGGGSTGFGNYVVLEHSYKLLNGSTITLYSRYNHLNSVSVSVGNTVYGGSTEVGRVGATGTVTGPHLDFQILKDGWGDYHTNSIDPYSNQLLELPSNIIPVGGSCCENYLSLVKNLYSTQINTAPGKPVLLNMKSVYDTGSTVTFSWNATANTTHYNMYLDKKNNDGSYSRVDVEHYASSGMTRKLADGSYRVLIQATNSNAFMPDGSTWKYTDSNWYNFEIKGVTPGKPAFKNMNDFYEPQESISFTWNATVNTTHYNLYLGKKSSKNGTYESYEVIRYANNGVTRKLPVGSYSAEIQSTNSTAWTDDGSSWRFNNGIIIYFVVKEDEVSKPVASATFNGHLYELYDDHMSWSEAKDFCAEQGGNLVTITNSAENAMIMGLTSKGSNGIYYLGCSDQETEGTWKWVTGEKFDYENWDLAAPEPNGGNAANCGEIMAVDCPPNKQFGEWIDSPNLVTGSPTDFVNNLYLYGYGNTGLICEKELNKVTFDLQGGEAATPIATRKVDGCNIWRADNTLIIYNTPNTTTTTNIYGREAAVNAYGEVIKIREYYKDEPNLAIPENGFVISGISTGRTDFVGALSIGDSVYVNYDTMTATAYEQYDSYLVENKYVNPNDTYGFLPVPIRENDRFEGWFTAASGGKKIGQKSAYAGDKLYAHWTAEGEEIPVKSGKYNTHIYELYDYHMSWEDAEAFCIAHGGHLVAVTDKAENDFIADFTQNGLSGLYYLGCTDKESEGTWKWVTGEKFDYENWDLTAPEPNGGTAANCGAIMAMDYPPNKQIGEWIDTLNSERNRFYGYVNAGFVLEKEINVTGVALDKTSVTLNVGERSSLTATVTPADAKNKAVTWSTKNSAVATVKDGLITGVSPGTTTVTVTTADGHKTAACTVTVKIPVQSISLNKTTLNMIKGDTTQLTATVLPANATNKKYTWKSSDTTVATVDNNGNIEAKSPGSTIINVTTEDSEKEANCLLIVSEPTPSVISVDSVSLNTNSMELTVGEKSSLTASVLPSNATNKSITWSSSVKTVATVSDTGEITALAKGTTVITVTTADGNKTAVCAIMVKEISPTIIPVNSISLKQTPKEMTVGSQITLTSIITPSDATNKKVAWNTSDISIATVNENGVVSAKAVGIVAITVTTADGGKTASCIITVTPAIIRVTDISLNKGTLNLKIGKEENLIATVLPNNATNKKVTWNSSNTNTATVDQNGKVTPISAGNAVITAQTEDGAKTASCVVTVTDSKPNYVSVTGITLNRDFISLESGDEVQLTPDIQPSNATNRNVIWESNNEKVATVVDGKVTAFNNGRAIITAITADGNKTALCNVTVSAASGNNPFTDVLASRYYTNAVLWALANGVTSGTSATAFSPDQYCTRGQVVTFLWRAMGKPEPQTSGCPFIDVSSDEYYYKAVLWAVEKKVTSGTSAKTFSPDATVTRAQFVTFLWRAEGAPVIIVDNPLTDIAFGQYYTNAVLWAVQKEVTAGTSRTTFSPDQYCTRGQVVTFLHRDFTE